MDRTQIAIGCIIQWYEVEAHKDYIQSVINAINYYNKEDIIVDLCFYLSQNIEQIDREQISPEVILKNFKTTEKILKDNNIKYKINYYSSEEIYTIADYRREFNENYCDIVDVLMWGESDALIPKQAFVVLDNLHKQVKNTTPKYISFFGMCKMWDKTWEILEHPDFTNHPYVSGPENSDKWWGTWYTMGIEEMNSINDKTEELEVTIAPQHKVNGCGLVISSEVIKSGVNIPRSIMLVHEDTAFMHMLSKVLGNIPQYIIKNILLVHNRKHPKKRMYVLNEDKKEINPTEKRESNDWYKKVWELDNINCNNLFNQHKSFTWGDVNPKFKIKK